MPLRISCLAAMTQVSSAADWPACHAQKLNMTVTVQESSTAICSSMWMHSNTLATLAQHHDVVAARTISTSTGIAAAALHGVAVKMKTNLASSRMILGCLYFRKEHLQNDQAMPQMWLHLRGGLAGDSRSMNYSYFLGSTRSSAPDYRVNRQHAGNASH
jgi:hypothetical protein